MNIANGSEGRRLDSWLHLTCANCMAASRARRAQRKGVSSTDSRSILLIELDHEDQTSSDFRPSPCPDCIEPSSRRTIRIWFQFCLTMVLAIGMAVKHGPDALIVDLNQDMIPPPPHDHPDPPSRPHDTSRPLRLHFSPSKHPHRQPISVPPSPTKQTTTTATTSYHLSVGTRRGTDSGYGSIATSEPLTKEDIIDETSA